MKVYIILFVLLLIFYPIFSVETPDSIKTRIYNVNSSLGIASGGSIGIGLFPILTIGCGYSTNLSRRNRILINFDLGIQKTFANLNLFVTF